MDGEFQVRTARLADAESIYALIREHTAELVPRSLGNVVETRLNILAARAETILTECREAHAKIVQALIDRKSLTREELLGLFLEEDEQAA